MSLFGGKKRTVRPDYTGLQVQTASSALPIPIVYGTNRIAPNVIWSDGFQTHAQRSRRSGGKGGGARSVTGYTYSTWIMFGLASDPLSQLPRSGARLRMSVRTQWLRDAWSFLATFVGKPGEFVVDTTNWRLVVHDGVTPGGHPAVSTGDLEAGAPVLGINTADDATNRLAVKADAALLSWDDVTPGLGDMRVSINKKSPGRDAARALLGLGWGLASAVLLAFGGIVLAKIGLAAH